MDVKNIKEFSGDIIYGISEMASLIKAQEQEIKDLKEELIESKIKRRSEPL